MSDDFKTEMFDNADSFHAGLAQINEGNDQGSDDNDDASDDSDEGEDNNTPDNDDNEPAEPSDNVDDGDDEVDEKYIPRKRFAKENQRRKEAEARLRETEERAIRSEEQLRMMNQAMEEYFGGGKQEKQNGNDTDDDYEPLDTEADKRNKAALKKLQDAQQELAEQVNRDRYTGALERQEFEFSKTNADFRDAYQHLIAAKAREYTSMGYSKDEANQMTMHELGWRAQTLFKSGKNVAKFFYETSKQMYGYKSKSTGPNLEKISENMRKSGSVKNIPGAPVSTGVSQEVLSTKGFDKLKNNRGSVDPEKFQEILRRIKSEN